MAEMMVPTRNERRKAKRTKGVVLTKEGTVSRKVCITNSMSCGYGHLKQAVVGIAKAYDVRLKLEPSKGNTEHESRVL